jgi:hypothetical protein
MGIDCSKGETGSSAEYSDRGYQLSAIRYQKAKIRREKNSHRGHREHRVRREKEDARRVCGVGA